MTQNFILPTIINTFLGIFFYVLMVEMNNLEGTPLFVFSTIARTFYGTITSFPLDKVLQTVLARLLVWVAILLLGLDCLQIVSLFNQFDAYDLADSLAILFGFVFVLCDVVFIIQLYRHSTEIQIVVTQQEGPKKEETQQTNSKTREEEEEKKIIQILDEVYGDTTNMRQRKSRIIF